MQVDEPGRTSGFFLVPFWIITEMLIDIVLLLLGLALLFGIVFRLVYFEYFVGFEPTEEFIELFEGIEDFPDVEQILGRVGRAILTTLKVLYWAFLAPVCWVIAYHRLRETEVKHGV